MPNRNGQPSTRVQYLLAELRRGLKADVCIVDTWNAPYTTGTFFVSRDEVAKEEVEKFADAHVHFPFWPLILVGKLWAKETWDD